MNIVQPYWELKGQRCPCFCGGEGFLVFTFCPNCGHVALICDEVGTVFSDAHNLSAGPQLSPQDKCSKCGVLSFFEFDDANSTQIQNAGFKVGEYD